MFVRLVDALLLLAAIIGCVFLFRSHGQVQALDAEHKRLVRLTGDLEIVDPTKVYLRALDTGDPMHFAWRIHYPPNYRQLLRDSNGSSMSSRSDPVEIIGRVRFRDVGGQSRVYTAFHGGSSLSSVNERGLEDAARSRWDQLEIHQVGRLGPQGRLHPAAEVPELGCHFYALWSTY